MTETIMLRGPFMWGTDMMRIVNRTSKIHHIQLHSQRYRNVGNTYTMLMKIQMQQFSFFFFPQQMVNAAAEVYPKRCKLDPLVWRWVYARPNFRAI